MPSRSQFTNQHYCLANTIFDIFTLSLFLYCFGNLTIKGCLAQSHIFYKQMNKVYIADEQSIYNLLKKDAFKIVEVCVCDKIVIFYFMYILFICK